MAGERRQLPVLFYATSCRIILSLLQDLEGLKSELQSAALFTDCEAGQGVAKNGQLSNAGIVTHSDEGGRWSVSDTWIPKGEKRNR